MDIYQDKRHSVIVKGFNIKLGERSISFTLEELLIFLVKPLFCIFIYYGMFSRFSGLLGLSGGMTAVLVSSCLFMLAAIHLLFFNENKKISSVTFFSVIFFIFIALTPLISSFLFNERIGHIFRFAIEIVVAFFIFFSFYYFIKERIISPKFFIYAVAILGFIASLQLITLVFDMTSLRRVRGLGGLNYIGNTFAVCSLTFIMILYSQDLKGLKKTATIFGLILVFMTMIFTGTRAALIAFIIGIFLFQVFGMKSKKFRNYVIGFSAVLFVPIFILALNIDMSLLLHRYSWAEISRMAMIRFELYYGAVADLTFTEFLFGRADLSALDHSLTSEDRFINPHNLFLSLIRFNGIFSFLYFFILLIAIVYLYLKVYAMHKHKPKFRVTEATIIIFLMMSFINVMFSGGKFTRNFYLFISLGYAVGYLDLLKSVKSPKEYLKMIL